MAEENNKEAIRRWSRIFSLFGVNKETPTNQQPNPSNDLSAPLSSGAFSNQELEYLPGFAASKTDSTKISHIETYLNRTSDNVVQRTREIQRFKVLTPEIGKAKMVLVPTIMSPNDVQTDSIAITVDCDDIEPETAMDLANDLTTYFNDHLKLSTKVADWIGEALFESGAKPVLILPKGPISLLTDAMDLEKELAKEGKVLGVGMENISIKMEGYNDVNISEESLELNLIDNEDLNILDIDIEDAITDQFADLMDEDSKIKTSVESMVKAAKDNKKKVNERVKDVFTFTTDYRSIMSGKDTKDSKVKTLTKRVAQSLYGSAGGRLFIGSDEGDLKDGDHPTLIPLPSESVIPVAVPGSPSEHIGYFILTDGFGNPIDETGTGDAASPYHSTNKSKSSCNATLNEGTQIIYGGSFGSDNITKNQQFEAASTVFGITIRKMLEEKLRDNDLEGITLKQHQAIMTTLFQRLIRKAKVRILFVPSTMVAYYAFGYRPDGTGKSILEDSSFLISLRNTMVIANVLTAIKNSTDRTRIEFNVGDQATNVEQIMDTVKKMFVSKRMLNFEHDPLTVARDLIQNSVSIIPKGLRGLEDLDVQTDNAGGSNSTEPDTDMMDKMSELVTLSMGIPPSALNRLSEDEYSRSIATTNLFFANEVRMKQLVVTETTTQLVRQYIYTSKELMTKIIDILKITNKSDKTDVDANDDTVNSDNLENQTDDKISKVEDVLYKVINGVSVNLPTPTIAATKAQYEELREAVDAVDQLVDKLFDEETIGVDDNETKEAYNAMKGFVRQLVLRKIAAELGPHGAINIPSINNIDQDEIADFNQAIINFKRQLSDMKKSLDKKVEEEGGGSRW